ncbi:hypothetical protein GU926_08290 [Nibribacter ruber]|uniref:Uncharacterized protein n=1 Tax=Nibribacter ruber TaxID=2698458 RepID=A0A6P1NZ87_9BACT|nr:hypothetical protein [Nibribacter ruber]QHL87435.1 hypothetical protein GU926_08290 [Nibribacter ruber]
MPTKRMHLSTNIEGLLRNFKRKKLTGIVEKNGRALSDSEARKFLAECQAKGWKLLPCSADCEGFDHFGGGCPGHQVENED